MDKLHAVLTWLHTAALYPLAGVPAWIVTMIVSFPVIDQLVKRAGWTTARSFVELVARFVLKSPLFGPSIALVPLLGDILHMVANDAAVPPTLTMRIKAALPEKKDPPDGKPPGASGTIKGDAVAGTVLVIMLFGSIGWFLLPSCNTLSGKAATAAGKACESLKWPTDRQAAELEVVAILADPLSWEADLEALAAKIGTDQVTCLVQTAVAGVQALIHPPVGDGGTLHTQTRTTYAPNIVAVNGAAWLAKHGGGAK